MAVYERSYEPYAGFVTDRRTRFLIVPKYAYQDIFKSKAFITFFVACFIWPVIQALMMYVAYNSSFLARIASITGAAVQPGSLFGLSYNANYFLFAFMVPQYWASFFLVFIVGPALISADMSNNGLPLYLSRPFSRTDYILGKFAVLAILLSLITWIPGMLLFLLHSYLAGGGWMFENLRIAMAIFFGSWISIVVLSLISLALSAYVKWKPLARLGLIGVFFVASGTGNIINLILRTNWGSTIDIGQLLVVVNTRMFGAASFDLLPTWAAWVSLLLASCFFLALLARKVRAYEVVR